MPYARVRTLRDTLEIPEALAWTLVRRGLDTPELAREFIDADGPLDPPETLTGVGGIADRLVLALGRAERIAIHGDYDCDGVCSTAVLARPLRAAGADVRTYLPSRFTDGYGVRVETVERLADEGVAVLVCVDCGTSAVDALTRAVELGVEPIVLDHHLAGGVRPPGLMANPALGQMPDDAPRRPAWSSPSCGPSPSGSGARLVGPDPDRRARPGRPGDGGRRGTAGRSEPASGDAAAWRRCASPRGRGSAPCARRPASTRARSTRARSGTPSRRSSTPPDACATPKTRSRCCSRTIWARACTIADELWALNAERREVEQAITAEAIAQIEASPPEIRDANAISPSAMAGTKASSASSPHAWSTTSTVPPSCWPATTTSPRAPGAACRGLDLHDLLGRASGRLTRWGGHAGAVGLQLPGRSGRRRSAASSSPRRHPSGRSSSAHGSARSTRSSARAKLTLETAEAFEALAPYGRGNPQPRLLMPACTAEAAGLMGKGGRHLNVRLHCGGAHLRAVGFGHGHRLDDLADGERVDVHVSLGIERYQGLVGPRVSIDRPRARAGRRRPRSTCAPACDLACTERVDPGPGPRRASRSRSRSRPPRSHRGPRARSTTSAAAGPRLVRIAALAGADAGVAVVVADVPRRRSMLDDVLHPERIGVELAVLGGVRCAAAPLGERMARAARRASIAVVDYAALAADHAARRGASGRPRSAAGPRPGPLVCVPTRRTAAPPGLDRSRDRVRAPGRARALGSATAGPADLARPRRASRWEWDAACEAALLGGDGDPPSRMPSGTRSPRSSSSGSSSASPGGLDSCTPTERRPLEHAGRVAAATGAARRGLRIPRSRARRSTCSRRTTTSSRSRVPGAMCCSAAAQRSTV